MRAEEEAGLTLSMPTTRGTMTYAMITYWQRRYGMSGFAAIRERDPQVYNACARFRA